MTATFIQNAYEEYQSNRLTEARVGLLSRGVYPFNIFLAEHTEAVNAAEKIEKLEEVAKAYSSKTPTFSMLVEQNSNLLLSGNPESVPVAMINYAFICEALSKCVHEVATVFLQKEDKNKTLYGIYKSGGVELLEFCIKKSQTYKLIAEDGSDHSSIGPVVKNLALELSKLSFADLRQLCESVPRMRLYVLNEVHSEMVKTVLEG